MNHLLIETELERYDAAALAQLLEALEPSWRARAERYKPFDARLRSAIGYTLLARLLREKFGVLDLPSIAADENGKPYLVDYPLFFSISHCKTAVACIVDTRPVGLDVQDILTDVSPALAARIAAPLDKNGCITERTAQLLCGTDRINEDGDTALDKSEVVRLHDGGTHNDASLSSAVNIPTSSLTPRDLTRLWTQKEASAKLDGRGLKIGLEHLPIEEHEVELVERENYILSYVALR